MKRVETSIYVPTASNDAAVAIVGSALQEHDDEFTYQIDDVQEAEDEDVD